MAINPSVASSSTVANKSLKPEDRARSVVIRAAALLAAGDIDGWRDYVSGFTAIADRQQRYIARNVAIDQALAVKGMSFAQLARLLTTAAGVVIDALDPVPAEPVLLNKAGTIFFELGATAAATKLFRAAQRLDPVLPHVAANLKACRARRRGNRVLRRLRPQLRDQLRDLIVRAEDIAERAQPTSGQTLSLCMIVKDEQEMLPRCLERIAPYVDEIVVVDTGSSDSTVAIAESFGAKILYHEWTGNFAEARNVGIDAAECDWFLILDADEVLVAGEGEKLRELLGHSWREAIYIVESNLTGDDQCGTSVDHNALRLFRNRPQYRYCDRIHEQILGTLPPIPERVEYSTVRIEHYGYLGVVRDKRSKAKRNLDLLEQQKAEGIDTAFLYYNLGSEYLVANDYQRARDNFERAWEMLADEPDRLRLPYFPALAGRYVRMLRGLGDIDRLDEFASEVLALLPDFTDIVLEHGMAAADAGQVERAEELYRRALKLGDAPIEYIATRGAGSFIAHYALGSLLLGSDRLEEASDHLNTALAENPEFLTVLQPLVRCRLALGDVPEVVCSDVIEVLGQLTPTVRFMLAIPFYEAGQIELSERLLRESLKQRPDATRIRLALVEALLSRSAFAEAEREVDRIDPLTPDGSLAIHSRMFATVCDPDADERRYEASRAYALAAGIDAGTLALFDSWWSGTVTEPLAAELAPLIGVMLEALTRIEAFDRFESLVGLLEQTEMPWRERRELLASIYLRRGFLESAADEWIAVVERAGPDRRALLGLAAVAERRELPDDAELLRGEAAALAA